MLSTLPSPITPHKERAYIPCLKDRGFTPLHCKVYLVGEYDWTYKTTLSALNTWLSTIEGNTTQIAGDCFWALFPHQDTYGFILHPDGYTLNYPGQTSDQQSKAQALRTHAYTQQGITTAPASGAMTHVPLLTSISCAASNGIAWQGVAGAAHSILQHAPSSNGPWATVSTNATDFLTPYPDNGYGPYDTWYRVAAVNVDGSSTSAYSLPMIARAGRYMRH